jgi:biotin transport system substrate-specific component
MANRLIPESAGTGALSWTHATQVPSALRDVTLVVAASLLVAASAKVTLPLLWSPVPLSLQNFAVLVVGFLLGPRLGMAAMVLYLLEGAAGLPFFASGGPGGAAQLFGPTGGFLMSYPLVAYVAGALFRARPTAAGALIAAVAAEAVLFLGGVSWLMAILSLSLAQGLTLALLPYLPGEALKVAAAAAIARRWRRYRDARA